jgi:penicillin V acylase-like amidase (Ntn superfamily)
MRTLKTALIISLAAVMGWACSSQACTTFQIQKQGQVFFGINYDWMVADALILINKRGTKKPPYVRPDDKGRPMEWTSKYGSITFNQYGRELPTGGMNQAGLVIESMSLRSTKFEPPDQRPYLGSTLLWKQYMLDTCATVEQVLAATKKVRLSPSSRSIGLHFLISDAGGGCAIIEFLDGKQVVYQGKSLPKRALTNNTYKASLKSLTSRDLIEIDWWNSFSRFRTAARMVSKYGQDQKQPPLDYAYKILKAVSQGATQWSIIYDQKNLKAYIRTKNNPKLRMVDLKKFDLSCSAPVMMLDIDADLEGNINSKFKPYTLAANKDLIKSSFGQTPFLKDMPKQALARLATFPDKCKCMRP